YFPGLDPAPRGAGPRHHVRVDGRHQHGARRADHDRGVRDVRRAGPVSSLCARGVRPLSGVRPAGGVRGQRTRRHGARTHGDPASLWPAARNAARDLGIVADPDPERAHAIRRAERASGESDVDGGRRRVDDRRRAPSKPHRDRHLRSRRARRRMAAADAHATGSLRPLGHAEPCDGRCARGAHGARRHADVRPRFGTCGSRRLRAVADRQCRTRPWPELHRRFVHGRRAGRRRTARRHGVGSARPRHRRQVPRGMVRRGARQDRRAGVHHRIHPEATPGIVRVQGPGGRGMMRLTVAFVPFARSAPMLGGSFRVSAGMLFAAAAFVLLVVFPVGNLLMPATSALHISDYAITLGGKIMCYAIVALAMDLIWGYTGILSLGHGLFFALGGYAMGMYLMRSIGHEGVYHSDLPDFMVFLDWKAYPWYWRFTDHFWYAAL